MFSRKISRSVLVRSVLCKVVRGFIQFIYVSWHSSPYWPIMLFIIKYFACFFVLGCVFAFRTKHLRQISILFFFMNRFPIAVL